MRSLSLAALLAASAALAQQPAPKPPEFTRSAEFTLEGKGAIYSVDLPVEVYKGLERRDLGDLRVQNAAAETVPHAFVRPASSGRKPAEQITLPYFPLFGAPGKPVEDMVLRVERRPDGTVKAVVSTGERSPAAARRTVAYVVDASAVKSPLRELRFDWQPDSESTSLDLRIEASDDLRSWRGAGSGVLIQLRHGDAVLERREIELSPTKANYLRISWRGQESWKLTGITARPVDAVAESPRVWLRVQGTAGAKPGEYVFELPASLPVDRLRFELPQENTVASGVLLAQAKPGAPERVITASVLYRMEHRGQKLVNPDLEIAPTTEPRWVLRVDSRGGGLGSGVPVLHAGYVPHRLVFVARGEAPFRVQFGAKEAVPSALAVQTLVPGYAADKELPALVAKLGEVRTQEIVKPTGIEAARNYAEKVDEKKLWLWVSLLAAVLVIVGMAFKLTRQMPKPGEAPKPPPPGEQR
ncbi:MAG TPA: DUF3999 domain-containing protein [Burkholderiales bacterium]|jgi:hypothetical protein|nr:DUF3999 domain-containing protein [Burkholderiales bacterium]